MVVVHKYALEKPETDLKLPWDAFILDALLEDTWVVIYAMVDTAHVKCTWRFFSVDSFTYMQEIPGNFLRTLSIGNGIVRHVFYRRMETF